MPLPDRTNSSCSSNNPYPSLNSPTDFNPQSGFEDTEHWREYLQDATSSHYSTHSLCQEQDGWTHCSDRLDKTTFASAPVGQNEVDKMYYQEVAYYQPSPFQNSQWGDREDDIMEVGQIQATNILQGWENVRDSTDDHSPTPSEEEIELERYMEANRISVQRWIGTFDRPQSVDEVESASEELADSDERVLRRYESRSGHTERVEELKIRLNGRYYSQEDLREASVEFLNEVKRQVRKTWCCIKNMEALVRAAKEDPSWASFDPEVKNAVAEWSMVTEWETPRKSEWFASFLSGVEQQESDQQTKEPLGQITDADEEEQEESGWIEVTENNRSDQLSLIYATLPYIRYKHNSVPRALLEIIYCQCYSEDD
ncbi:hypothetical protein M231_07502 [Tremella mesenterica]|uniref:Uncharacterized protein n=1 Tax=Tremella mesenterica TaxID=5217 RepID=A0A4Q1B907_TREME|nr:hypothetical protein M231_07502 [Tremella mesenterica]